VCYQRVVADDRGAIPAVDVAVGTTEAAPVDSAVRERKKAQRNPVLSVLKFLAFAAIMYFFVLPLIPGFRNAAHELRKVNPLLLGLGLGLQIAALYSYSLLTKAALGESSKLISSFRLYRIQMSTKALGSAVPGGSAASSALGYRLLTLSGIPGPDAGFALGTAGLVSAVMLNLIFWVGLIISIPLRGVNPAYVTAAIVGVLIMGFAAAIVFGLMQGQRKAEQALRWVARRLHQNEDRVGEGVRHIVARIEDLTTDPALLARVAGWAAANWLLDMASLWVFLRAFGGSLSIDGLMVSFGLANIAAVVPITPGGLGIVEGVYVPTLVGFGLSRSTATLGVASYRLAQFFFPIALGAFFYLTLRVGPWKIERREELKRMREMVADPATRQQSVLEFDEKFAPRRPKSDESRELARHYPELFDLTPEPTPDREPKIDTRQLTDDQGDEDR
jgi:putative heme transporter